MVNKTTDKQGRQGRRPDPHDAPSPNPSLESQKAVKADLPQRTRRRLVGRPHVPQGYAVGRAVWKYGSKGGMGERRTVTLTPVILCTVSPRLRVWLSNLGKERFL